MTSAMIALRRPLGGCGAGCHGAFVDGLDGGPWKDGGLPGGGPQGGCEGALWGG